MMPDALVPAWGAFQAQAEQVQNARRVVLSCLPVGRVDPAPVPVGLDVLRDELMAVQPDLEQWRVDPVEQHFQACRSAIAQALAAIPDARQVAETTSELEELLEAVAEVVEPLGDAFQDAERHWLSLRERPPR